MEKLGVLLLLFLSVTHAQIYFPGDEIGGSTSEATPSTGQDGMDAELVEILNVDDRQNFNPNQFSSSCVTPDGQRGTCGTFSSCSSYASFRNVLRRPHVIRYLSQRICRRLPSAVHVCCPISSQSRVQPRPRPRPSPSTSIIPPEHECGVPVTGRIVGGNKTEPGEWPWLAAVGYRIGNGFFSNCGGTLITRRHVLSAGHCFGTAFGDPTMVRLGEHDLSRSIERTAPQDFNIKERREAGYNRRTNENDIILLILDGDAVYNDYVLPACLPFNERGNSFVGQSLTVIGWGRTNFEIIKTSDVPLKAAVPVLETRRCVTAYQSLPRNKRPVIDERSLCAGNGHQDACSGDSGGPLNYLSPSGRYYIVGVVSFGVGCAREDFPGVYTRVTNFLDWIVSNVQ